MKKIPLITIVGVPNTGKSTFFNRVIGQRKALTHSAPGMTRDIYKKPFTINNKTYYLQDSGGFFLDEDIITSEINKRIFNEARKSDVIIFLFDGKRELLGYEKDLYLDIIKINDQIIPIVNKVDNPDKFILPNSYYALKQDFLFTSAEHNIGFGEVLEEIEKRTGGPQQEASDTGIKPDQEKAITDMEVVHIAEGSIQEEKKEPQVATGPRISIIGKPNVGKSSIINKILREDFVIVSPLPGTTRDSVDLEIKRGKRTFTLVDNAGIRKLQKIKEDTESAAVIRAEKDIRNADIIIFVIDISRKIDQNDLLIAQKIQKSAKPVIIAANKWDLVNAEEKGSASSRINKIKDRFNFLYFAPVLLVSAETGKNIFSLIDQAEKIFTSLSQKIKTSHLNKIVQQVLAEKKVTTDNNRGFNPKYVSVESYQPFFISFFTTSKYKLKPFHERYLKKRLAEELNLEGVPIFFKIVAKPRNKK